MATQKRKACYYGCCPLSPGTRLTVTEWYESPPDRHLVLLKFSDEYGVEWIGPEYSRGVAAAVPVVIQTGQEAFTVVTTTIDAYKGQTDFVIG